MSNKQSSVEWLFDELARINFEYATNKITPRDFQEQKEKIKQQAKSMQKEEIINATVYGARFIGVCTLDVEQYYNETFGGNNEQQ